jgi:hypothetical protein
VNAALPHGEPIALESPISFSVAAGYSRSPRRVWALIVTMIAISVSQYAACSAGPGPRWERHTLASERRSAAC